jgi:hypothetical protein
MAMVTAKQPEASTHKDQAGNGQVKEKLTNKSEAVRRALAKLGKKAMPAEIRDFVKTNFGIEMANTLISVYKSKLAKTKGRPGRKPQAVQGTTGAAPKPSEGIVTFKDLRAMKDITNRIGPARMKELVELMTD